MSPAFDIPPVNSQTQPSAPRTGPGFWPGFGVGCAVSFVGLLLLFVMSGIVALAFGVNKAMTFTGAAKAKRDAMVAMAEEAADEAAKGAAEAAGAMSVEELEIQSALDNEDFDRAEQLARALVERHQDDRSARSLLQMVRIERAVAAEEISSADGLLKDARAQGFDIEPTTELGVAELWLSEGEPQRSLEIAERVLKELDAPPASSVSDGKEAGPPDAEEDAEYRRYVRGVALVMRGLCRAELGDPASAVVDLTAAVELAPDEETAADWRNYLDEVREKSR